MHIRWKQLRLYLSRPVRKPFPNYSKTRSGRNYVSIDLESIPVMPIDLLFLPVVNNIVAGKNVDNLAAGRKDTAFAASITRSRSPSVISLEVKKQPQPPWICDSIWLLRLKLWCWIPSDRPFFPHRPGNHLWNLPHHLCRYLTFFIPRRQLRKLPKH